MVIEQELNKIAEQSFARDSEEATKEMQSDMVDELPVPVAHSNA